MTNTTSSLLKQALEAAQAVIDRWETSLWKDAEPTANVIARLRKAASALTAFDSLSEYDKAIHVLAPYLPDGWVAQAEDHSVGWWPMHVEEPGDYRALRLDIPACQDWRDSLRRITHNSDGTVTVERG